MESIRQQKVANLVQQELSEFFRLEARTICKGAMVSVTIVRIAPDLGLAKVYLSVFASPDKKKLINTIKNNTSEIRRYLGKKVGKQLRVVPELNFYLDDSIDQTEEIEKLLKK